MTISSSLNAGVAGLAANASRLSTISDNIANSATNGYKRVQASFDSMVLQEGAGSYTAGGVRMSSQRLIDQSGALTSTTNATDIAVGGRGFVPVTEASALDTTTGQYPMSLATTGSFRPDDEGYLRSESGLVLMGWPAAADGSIPAYSRDTASGLQPVQIKTNELAGEPTTRMSLGVNLPATEAQGGGGETFDLSVEYFDGLGLAQNVGVEFTPTGAANTWDMVLSDSATGADVGTYTLEFNDGPGDGGTLSQVTPVGASPPYDGANGTVTVDVGNGQQIDISIGVPGGKDGLSQLSDTFAPTKIETNGAPVGTMTSVEIDANGFVYASFDTGLTSTIYQIPLADLPNPNGLEAMDNQTYRTTNESGPFFLWDAGSGPTGEVVSYALEQSTTDVAGELTQLIQTQRAYSSNAKVIQTVDEMLQETTNIKR